ncbi:MAG TPA: hypothetical protein VJ488_02885 [Dehalococcoidia bacterium]|nr:hypothetical protein [Dehalococcoidia bacterium]
MGIDLFQISQMHDIYFTLQMWYLLSPELASASSRRRQRGRRKTGRQVKGTRKGKLVKAEA